MDAEESTKDAGVCRFGKFILDTNRGRLLRLGEELSLRPKSMALLTFLVQNPGRLLSKNELIDVVWGDQIVSEGALAQCLLEIRTALNDHAHTLLRNVPRRGYIFEADVTWEAGESADPVAARTRRGGLIAAGIAAALAASLIWLPALREPPGEVGPWQTSIAVLPFDDMSAARDQGFFADGIAEEILHLLAQIPELRVIARTSSFAFRGKTPDIATIADRLEVEHVLEGSVRREGDRILITSQLVEGATSSHLWSQRYEVKLGSVLDVQTAIAKKVAEALRVELTDTRAQRDMDPVAYENYLQGRFFYDRRMPGDLDRAEEHFRRAIEIDPDFATPLVGLTAVYAIRAMDGGYPLAESLEIQRVSITRALELEPRSPEAHVRAGYYHRMAGNEARSVEHLKKAHELGSSNSLALAIMSGLAAREGDVERSIRLQRRAVQVDPLNYVRRSNLGHQLLRHGQLDEARTAFMKAIEIVPHHRGALLSDLALIDLLQNRFTAALEKVPEMTEEHPRRLVRLIANRKLGRTAEAQADFAALEDDQSYKAAFYLALSCSYFRETDQALHWLEVALDRARSSYPDLVWLKFKLPSAPLLVPLHNDPGWKDLRDGIEQAIEERRQLDLNAAVDSPAQGRQ